MHFDQYVKDNDGLCPMCEKGTLILTYSEINIAQRWGKRIEIFTEVYRCSCCTEIFLTDLSEKVVNTAFVVVRKHLESEHPHVKKEERFWEFEREDEHCPIDHEDY